MEIELLNLTPVRAYVITCPVRQTFFAWGCLTLHGRIGNGSS